MAAISNDWLPALKPEFGKEYYRELYRFVNDEYRKGVVYPPADHIFEALHLPYVTGRVWTTDAPYRETYTAVEKRKQEGCIAVEMELAGVQAVCNFHGIELYDFLVTGDILDGDTYNSDGLAAANHSLDKFHVALKILEQL